MGDKHINSLRILHFRVNQNLAEQSSTDRNTMILMRKQ